MHVRHPFLLPVGTAALWMGCLMLVAQTQPQAKAAQLPCDDKSGSVKEVCIRQAKAAEAKVLNEAKQAPPMGTAMPDVLQDQRDADYKMALLKCDSKSGVAKGDCVAAAKAKFGKK
jgi:hypothetical protein